jgi:hypothetical protein
VRSDSSGSGDSPVHERVTHSVGPVPGSDLGSRRGLSLCDLFLTTGLFTTASRTALGPTQPPVQWVPGALSWVVKRPGREADHSPPSSAEVSECADLYLYAPNTSSWRGAQFKKKSTGTALPSPLPLPYP